MCEKCGVCVCVCRCGLCVRGVVCVWRCGMCGAWGGVCMWGGERCVGRGVCGGVGRGVVWVCVVCAI